MPPKKKKAKGPPARKKLHPHMKNLEQLLDGLELDIISKKILASRWFVNKDRLIRVKEQAWWQTRLIKVLAGVCALIAPVLMIAGLYMELANCQSACETQCQDDCDTQMPENLYLLYMYWTTFHSGGSNQVDNSQEDQVNSFFTSGSVSDVDVTGYSSEESTRLTKLCHCDCLDVDVEAGEDSACLGWGDTTKAASCFLVLSAVFVALDMFYKVDYIVEMKIDIATELTSMGWEFASLSGDFKEFPTHQEGFEKFAHMTEVLLGKLPPEAIPNDYITAEESAPKPAAPKAK